MRRKNMFLFQKLLSDLFAYYSAAIIVKVQSKQVF